MFILKRMTFRCRGPKAGYELRSPAYQEKVMSTTPKRNHQFIAIWAMLHLAVRLGFPFYVKKLFRCNIVTDVTDGYYVVITVVTT
jgi:hypothetical protein